MRRDLGPKARRWDYRGGRPGGFGVTLRFEGTMAACTACTRPDEPPCAPRNEPIELAADDDSLERFADDAAQLGDLPERGPVDARVGAVANEERHGALANDDRNDRHLGVSRSLKVCEKDRIEARGCADADDRHASFARVRQQAREVERHADAENALSRGAAAEAVSALGDVAMHEKERGVLEKLPRKVERKPEQAIAIGRFFGFSACVFEQQRAPR
jgi:hypothetical protein